MKHQTNKHSYRLTDREQRILSLGREETCRECKSEFKTGHYSRYNPTCPECMRKRVQGEVALGRRQKLYVEYLLKIKARQVDLIGKRGQGLNGIAVDNDINALEWQILEYRRFRIMQRLGMKPDFSPKTLRKRAKSAIRLINEINDFNFSMTMRDRP